MGTEASQTAIKHEFSNNKWAEASRVVGSKKKMGGARGVCKQFFLNSEPETAPMQPVCVMSLGRKKARGI